MIVCWCAGLIDMVFIWWYYRRQNRIKAEIRAQPFYTKVVNQEWLDLTDTENPELVYTL
jgi:ACS family allantoate permease-like MFS transporter